jgi:transposase
MLMAAVMIGIDPHKGSHTAVAIGVDEEPFGQAAGPRLPIPSEKLVAWAAAWPERTWAVEGWVIYWPSSW